MPAESSGEHHLPPGNDTTRASLVGRGPPLTGAGLGGWVGGAETTAVWEQSRCRQASAFSERSSRRPKHPERRPARLRTSLSVFSVVAVLTVPAPGLSSPADLDGASAGSLAVPGSPWRRFDQPPTPAPGITPPVSTGGPGRFKLSTPSTEDHRSSLASSGSATYETHRQTPLPRPVGMPRPDDSAAGPPPEQITDDAGRPAAGRRVPPCGCD